MNNCVFNGRLTKDPELKTSQNGKSYARFCIAVKRISKSGDHPQSDFIDCLAWEKTADIIVKYCSKGDLIGVIGRLQTRLTDNKTKIVELIVTEIDLIGGKKTAEADSPEQEPSLPFEV